MATKLDIAFPAKRNAAIFLKLAKEATVIKVKKGKKVSSKNKPNVRQLFTVNTLTSLWCQKQVKVLKSYNFLGLQRNNTHLGFIYS